MCLTICGSHGLTIGRGLTLTRARQLSARQLLSTSKPSSVRTRASPVTQAVLPLHNTSLAALTATQLPPMLQHLASPAIFAVTVLGLVALYAWRHARSLSRRSELILQRTAFNQGVLSRCPTINSVYQTWPLLSNGHVETIFASKLRRNSEVSYTRESFKTPDGGTVHIDYHNLPNTIVSAATCSLYVFSRAVQLSPKCFSCNGIETPSACIATHDSITLCMACPSID